MDNQAPLDIDRILELMEPSSRIDFQRAVLSIRLAEAQQENEMLKAALNGDSAQPAEMDADFHIADQ